MNPLLLASIAAVLADSVVTIIVGLKLNKTAEEKISQGVEDIIKHAPEILAKAIMQEPQDAGE
jgi:hypothetical protein